MDQDLKARLVGAIVLVVAGIVVIPLLLDGSPSQQAVNRIELPVPDGGVRTQRISVDPAADTPASARPETTDPPTADTLPDDAAVVQAAPSDLMLAWAVQAGSFSGRENADKLTQQLQADGFAAFVMRHSDGGRQLYRVRVGPEKDRAQAEALAERLRRTGREVAVVRHP